MDKKWVIAIDDIIFPDAKEPMEIKKDTVFCVEEINPVAVILDGPDEERYVIDLETFEKGFAALGNIVCPCCGKHLFSDDHSFEICPVCGWENDPLQRRLPDFEGGANHMSLNQAREAFEKGEPVR